MQRQLQLDPSGKWIVKSNQDTRMEEVAFDASLWADAPKSLEKGAADKYRELARAGEHGAWWPDVCAGPDAGDSRTPGIRRFIVDTEPEHWERPWEAMVASLLERRWPDVSFVRRVGGYTDIPQKQEIGERLRILFLSGADDDPTYGDLDLDTELEQLEETREKLDKTVKCLIDPIVAEKPTTDNLVDLIKNAQANCIWFSGHARSDPPGLLLADKTWLTPEQFSKAIETAGGPIPVYVALWACRTGQLEKFAAPRTAPPFIAALAQLGVSSVLATLGLFNNAVVPTLSRELLANLAVGRPLDHALARARAVVMKEQIPEGDRQDWVCPVAWCVHTPPEKVHWSPNTLPARRKVLSQRLLPDGLEALPPAGGSAATQVWSDADKIWIKARRDAVSRSTWLGLVMDYQARSDAPVLVIDFDGRSPERVLRDWAENFQKVADEIDDPDGQLRYLAEKLKENTQDGWSAFCQFGLASLGLMQPPEDTPNWFWTSLQEDGLTAFVLSEDFPVNRAAEGWKFDTMDPQKHPDKTKLNLKPAANVFAVLGYPVDPLLLRESLDISQEVFSKWLDAGIVVRTRAGCIMPISKAHENAQHLTGPEFLEAHRLAFGILYEQCERMFNQRRLNEEILKACLHHANSSEEDSFIVHASERILQLYRGERRASALLGVFSSIRRLWDQLQPDMMLGVSWAHLNVGEPDSARYWLEKSDLEDFDRPDQVTYHMLLAEAHKSSGETGSKEAAKDAIETAVSLAEEDKDEASRRVLLRARHELARFTHFVDYDPGGAIRLYNDIVNDWSEFQGANLDLAIALRNLAEAHLDVGDTQVDDREAQYKEAEFNLRRARDMLPADSADPVVTEIEYVAGRLLQRRSEDNRAVITQFERCEKVGEQTNNIMRAAIARARLFWLKALSVEESKSFDPGNWDERAEELSPFDRHGWVARVTVNGHLRCARRLLAAGLNRQARGYLMQAKGILDDNPDFDRGKDRQRIVQVQAGLSLASKNPAAWDELRKMYDWSMDYLSDTGWTDAETAWEEIR